MSALTSLFTSMANKIRSKVGGSDTYTPTEMVSAIDDVYDAGVSSATTPITPSNASPAPMTSGTGYKPSANGYAIQSYVTITPDDDSPASLWSSGGELKKVNEGFAIERQPERRTPSNTAPPQLAFGNNYYINGYGYLIQDYEEVTPSSTPVSFSVDDFACFKDSGVIVDAITSITPSDSSPAALTANTPVTPSANGYAIEHSPTSLTPADSTNPPSIASGTIYKGGGSGYAVASKPSALSPSDSSPVAISDGGMYLASGGGYAIESQPSNKTPDDTTPPSVTSGEIVKMGGAGYLYATQHGSNFAVAENKSVSSSDYANSFTFSNYSGKSLLVLIRAAGSTSTAYNRFDNCTASGGTLTKLANEFGANSFGYGTFFQFDITSNSATITLPNNYKGYMIAFGIT